MAKSETSIRIPVHTVILQRAGKRVIPKIGEPFEFTEKEISDIESVNKGALRMPANQQVKPVEPTDADRVAGANIEKEPARDTRTPAQKKKDEERLSAAEAEKKAGKKGAKKAGDSETSEEEI